MKGNSKNKPEVQIGWTLKRIESVGLKYFPKQDYVYSDNREAMWHDIKMHLETERKIFLRKEKSTDRLNYNNFSSVSFILLLYLLSLLI